VLNKPVLRTVVIIPTYNERENIEPLVEALQFEFERVTHEMHILVVDDGSPDGTAGAVRGLQQSFANLHLIEGKKGGLGVAYIRGIRYASEHLGADVVFEMDADFSHKPSDVVRLMSEIDRGADFVIGSRYVEGGSVTRDWGWLRRLGSSGGNIAARYIAGLTQIRDCTAGFRAIRTSVLRQIDLGHLQVQGYAFQVALLHAAVLENAAIREIPVDFIDRTRGVSKLGLRDILEFIVNVWWIRLQNSRKFLKFAIVGISGVIVNLGFFTLFLQFDMNKYLASPVAIELSIIWNFLLNNYWTFRDRDTKDRMRIRGLKFNLVSFLALGVSYGTFVALSLVSTDGSPQIHQLVGIIPAMLINYLLNSYWTFRQVPAEERKLGDRRDTTPKKGDAGYPPA
jgi:dolichol-phosphate mannosyltransferase